MFVEDLKKEFFDVLLKNHVAVVVERDADAVCAWWSLRALLRGAGVAHSVACVGGLAEAAAALREAAGAGAALLLGLGARDDLVAALRPSDHQTLFVLDAHRPAHVCNVYSDSQVRLLYKDSEDDNIPEFDDIFRDDEDEDDDEAEAAVAAAAGGGAEGRAAAAARRRQRAAWARRRDQLLVDYTQFTYYATPVGVVAGELAARLGGGAGGAAWAACAGAAAALLAARRPPARYLLDAQRAAALAGAGGAGGGAGGVALAADVWLPLYRRWTLWGALRAALPGAPHAALLADAGVPLAAARQPYRTVDVELRARLVDALSAALARRGEPPLAAPALLLTRPQRRPVAAQDLVYTIMGLIDNPGIPAAEALAQCLRVLAGREESAGRGERAAVAALAAITDLLRTARPQRRPPFLHLHLPQEWGGPALLQRGAWLRELARRLAVSGARGPAGAGGGGGPGALVTADVGDMVLLVALPPDHANHTRNVVSAALEQAALEAGVELQRPRADPALAAVPAAAAPLLLTAFTALLQ